MHFSIQTLKMSWKHSSLKCLSSHENGMSLAKSPLYYNWHCLPSFKDLFKSFAAWHTMWFVISHDFEAFLALFYIFLEVLLVL